MMKSSQHYMLAHPNSIQQELYQNFQHLCYNLYYKYQFSINYITSLILYMMSLDGRLYDPISLYPDLKEISFIKIIFKVYFSII